MIHLLKPLQEKLFRPSLAYSIEPGRAGSRRRFLGLLLAAACLSGGLTACAGGSSTDDSLGASTTKDAAGDRPAQPEVELTLVSFAVTKAAHDAIIPKFVEKWQKEKQQTVKFNQSYGGSGSQARAVIDGLEADIIHLAIGSDVQKVSEAGLIETGWEQEFPSSSVVSRSVAALVTREGNPKNIKTWQDLAKPDVKFITADPKTSGVARWNFFALWNAGLQSGGGEAAAQEFVSQAYRNVPILTKNAREATDIFLKQGQGDALINYENEVLLAIQNGEKPFYVIPEPNISIDNPIAIVDTNVDKHGTREVAEAFVEFLFSPEAQAEFTKVGFRPSDETALSGNKELEQKYPKINQLAQSKDFGDWKAIEDKFFKDGAIFDQIQQSK